MTSRIGTIIATAMVMIIAVCCNENKNGKMEGSQYICEALIESQLSEELLGIYQYTPADVKAIAVGERQGICTTSAFAGASFTVNIQEEEGEAQYVVATAAMNDYTVTEADHIECAQIGVPSAVSVLSDASDYNFEYNSVTVFGNALVDSNEPLGMEGNQNHPVGIPLVGGEFELQESEVEFWLALPSDGSLWIAVAEDGTDLVFSECE